MNILIKNDYGNVVGLNKKNLSLLIFGGFLLIGGIISFASAFDRIPINHVGVVFNKVDGGVEEKVEDPGWVLHAPFTENVYDVSTYTHALHLKPGTNEDGETFDDSLVTQTLDGQWLATRAELHYRIEPENAIFVFEQFHSKDRDVIENLRQKLPSIVQTAVEKVTTKYDVVGILGAERSKVQVELEESITEALAKYGITMQAFTLLDTDAGDAIEKAIADEAVTQQQIETEKQRQAQQTVANQIELEKSQAEAERKLVQAQADAEKVKLEAAAQAEANMKIADSVTEELVRYEETQARKAQGWITHDVDIQFPNPQ